MAWGLNNVQRVTLNDRSDHSKYQLRVILLLPAHYSLQLPNTSMFLDDSPSDVGGYAEWYAVDRPQSVVYVDYTEQHRSSYYAAPSHPA